MDDFGALTEPHLRFIDTSPTAVVLAAADHRFSTRSRE
jgi:hypothetical protein